MKAQNVKTQLHPPSFFLLCLSHDCPHRLPSHPGNLGVSHPSSIIQYIIKSSILLPNDLLDPSLVLLLLVQTFIFPLNYYSSLQIGLTVSNSDPLDQSVLYTSATIPC